MTYSNLTNNYHHFEIDVAVALDVHCAIILSNLKYWVDENAQNGRNYFDGLYWTYNSKKAYQRLFPYFTERQIDYALAKLFDAGIILKGQYSEDARDNTNWYTLNPSYKEALQICIATKQQKIKTSLAKQNCKTSKQNCDMAEQICTASQTNLYDIYTNNKQDKNTDNKPNKKILSVLDFENQISVEVKNENENPKRKKLPPKKEKGIDEAIEVLEYLNEMKKNHLGVTSLYKPTKTNLNFITARLKDGYSVDDLIGIIKFKFWQWKDDAKMKMYLRITTLFNATNCQDYTQEIEIAKNTPNYAEQYKQSRTPKQAGNIQKGNGNKLSAEKFSALINSIPKDAR